MKSSARYGYGCSGWSACIALLIVLASTSMSYAAPPQGSEPGGPGDGPVRGCVAAARGRLSASPSSIDRFTSTDRLVTFTWSIVVPPNCSFLSVSLSPLPDRIALSGTLQKVVSRTRTFQLTIWTQTTQLTLASATVTVSGDPGLIIVSDGRQVTPDDIAKFDAQWMQPYDRAMSLKGATDSLSSRYDAGVWITGERMAALARMYELTHQRRYLNHLREFIEVALKYRDDNYKGKPVDEFRGKNEPAWGGRSVNSGGLNRVDEVVSSVYAYPIAAFARIVAEDPALASLASAQDRPPGTPVDIATAHATYGSDAVRYANAVIQTMWVFMPQMHYRKVENFFEGYLTQLDIYKTKPTAWDCAKAYKDEYDKDPPFFNENESARKRLEQMAVNCNNLRKGAGLPMSYNENQAFMMMLIELWRALESNFYRQSPDRATDAEPSRVLIPVLVSRHHRYFVNHLEPKTDNPNVPFFWHHADDLPADVSHGAEDTSHGALDMRYLEVLRRNFARLNARAAPRGEPIPLDSGQLQRFANTFLQKIVRGKNFAADVAGRSPNPADSQNGLCDGWINLAVANVKVYHVCHEITLRIVNGSQPYLSIGNHSALLMNKWVLPRRVPDPRGGLGPPTGSVH